MNLDKAREIVLEITKARKQWGKQAKVNYTFEDILDAIVAMEDGGNWGAASDEEVTKLRRQLAACQNREKARQNKGFGDDTIPVV